MKSQVNINFIVVCLIFTLCNYAYSQIQVPSRWVLVNESSTTEIADIPFEVLVITDSTDGFYELYSEYDTIDVFNYWQDDENLYFSSIDYNCNCFDVNERKSHYELPYKIASIEERTYLIIICRRNNNDIKIVYVLK